MKKQIALIIVSMLASLSVAAQNVNENCNNDMCRIHSKTPICEEDFGVIQPELPDFEVKPDIPEVEVPEVEAPDTSLAHQVLDSVNTERAKYGLSALTYDVTLTKAANVRAAEIKTLFSHTRPDGSSCFTVLDEVGYRYRTAGENVAYGQRTVNEVMTAWMNSDGHRANILGDYTHVGIGVYESGGVIYWAQMFTK